MKFAVVGVAGFVARRHLRAIRDTGNQVVAATDPSDSVGQMDEYSYAIDFFTSFDEFLAYLQDRNKSTSTRIDYVSVCSPNYLHAEQSIACLKAGSNVICEKPLVIDPDDLARIAAAEAESGCRLFNVLQLRLHPSIVNLKKQIAESRGERHRVELTYITSRGHWYLKSWKGKDNLSGGIAANIGIHFFDMLMWVFGDYDEANVVGRSETTLQGTLKLEKADVTWKLSIDAEELPETAIEAGQPTYRSILVDEAEFEFSEGFADLHTAVYEDILAGKGYGVNAAGSSIQLVHQLRRD